MNFVYLAVAGKGAPVTIFAIIIVFVVFRFLDFARNDNYKMTLCARDARSEPGMTVVENRTTAEAAIP